MSRGIFLCTLLLLLGSVTAQAAESEEIQQFVAAFEGAADVKVNPATGAARFVRLAPGAEAASTLGTARTMARPRSAEEISAEFLARHGGIFGLRDARAELSLVSRKEDALGGVHLTYIQQRGGVPVYAALLRTHFDRDGQLRAVNGITVPDGELDLKPSRSAADAERAAVARVAGQGKGEGVTARGSRLVVYRTGLLKGVPGENLLAWLVEVGNGDDVREFVFVEAHRGKVVDQFTGMVDALHRRAYNTTANFPATPFWVEGDAFPTADVEANNVIEGSGESYNMYSQGFGRDSFDGAGAIMHGVFRRTQTCPNASWNGVFTSYCAGVTPDDVVAHEWTHAYTEFTHGLIYAWQSGALNESYSDIYGEVVDFINGRGTDTPGGPRTGGNCSSFTAFPVQLRVNSPASIAGDYAAGSAAFGPYPTSTGTTGDMVVALDGGSSPTDGCEPIVNDLVGKVAIVDRGTCTFVVKVKNAQNAGAIAVVVANNAPGPPAGMGGADPTITIPSIMVSQATGATLKTTLAAETVNGTVRQTAPGATDDTYRWLVGEDSPAFGGAIRDMWTPTCYGDPGKVTDTQYQCGPIESDNGGVHINSGVPNHAFALLVDGGTYNGQTVGAIGLVKAAHIYYRAMTVYQGPASNFADHADSIEQSCSDLIGVVLADLVTGAPSGEALSASDCEQVAKAALAVELRTPPTQCGFEPILAKNPPDRCEAGTAQANVYFNDFESNPIGPWTVAHSTSSPDFTPRDWVWSSELPDRPGSALFGINFPGGTCAPGGDESGVIHATSPVISLPPGAANPRLTFDHWIATEGGWDGGNVKISVNGGAWQVVAPADFTYNPYNGTLFTVADGNTNPMAGEPAFTGTDEGSVSGSWGRSHVNLAPYAGPGDNVQLRLDLGNDGCTGFFGWYVHDPTLYVCTPADPPLISINDVSVTEGNSGLTPADFRVTLSHASADPVEVWFITLPGSAFPFFDFVPDIGKVTIPPLQLEGRIRVKVVGERFREKDETYYVLLFAPHGGAILDGVGKGTIVNDDGGRR